jgi:predicted metal-binding membrane protein
MTADRPLFKSGTIGVLLLVAAGAWVISGARMAGMDAGPSGDLGAAGWFMATWVLMMVAMMVPVIAPLAADEGRASRSLSAGVLGGGTFVAAYLAVWAAAGLVVYEVLSSSRHLIGEALSWGHGGRWAAVAVLAIAAAYQLTVRKRQSLKRCREVSGSAGARAGIRAGTYCLGSSWAMMAALFALGAMSLWWMALVAVLIAAERLPRPSTPGRLAAAAVFLALAACVAISPGSVPGLTIPGSPAAMKAMMRMSPSQRSMR